MNNEALFSTESILFALRRIHEEQLSGVLTIPYKSITLTLSCAGGALLAVDSATAAKLYLPYLQANVAGFSEPGQPSDTWFPLLPEKAVAPQAIRFLCGYLNRLFEPEVDRLFHFRESSGPTGAGFLPLGVPTLVCRFLGVELNPAAVNLMKWDFDRRIQLVSDVMSLAASIPLTPHQAFMLTRLHSGVTLRDFTMSCGFPEEQVLRAMLIFSFFRFTRKEEDSDPSVFSLAALAQQRRQDARLGANGDEPAPGGAASSGEAAMAGPIDPVPDDRDAGGGNGAGQNHSSVRPDEHLEKHARECFVKGKEAYKARRFQDACEYFQEATRLAPQVPECHFMWGKTLAQNPMTMKEAEELLLKAEELRPGQIEFSIELARLYDKIGLRQRARKYWEQVLRLDPRHREAASQIAADDQRPVNVKDLLSMDLKNLFRPGRRR